MFFPTSVVLIIGNGFDLHLGLKSKMSDFFINKILDCEEGAYFYNGNNLLYALIYYRFFAHGTYDYGVFRRIDNNDPSWMDVEKFIKKIAKDSDIRNFLVGINKKYANGVLEKSGNNLVSTISHIFLERNPSKSGAFSIVHNLLLEDLLEFEEDFRRYMLEILSRDKDYNKIKKDFIKQLIKQTVGEYEETDFWINVFNFNYTSLADVVNYSSNVHGTLDNRIVIGYDSTVENKDGDIYELSKDWQKVGIEESDKDLRQIGSKSIIFYGHSLGEQDYPYFFELFDHFRILEDKLDVEQYSPGMNKTIKTKTNNVFKLFFCYSQFGTEKEQKNFLLNYQMSLSRLLNAYEDYKNGHATRNTIITKLNAQGRLRLVKVSDVDD